MRIKAHTDRDICKKTHRAPLLSWETHVSTSFLSYHHFVYTRSFHSVSTILAVQYLAYYPS